MVEIYDGYDGSVNDKYFSTYKKNFGNKLFIYGCSRIIADLLGYDLISPENALIRRELNSTKSYHEQVFPFGSVKNGNIINHPIKEVYDNDIVDVKSIENLIKKYPNHGFIIKSYFSKYDYIKPYKNMVKNYYKSITLPKRTDDSLVIMLRDSYADRTFKLPDSYYLDILEKENFSKLYVSLDHEIMHRNLLTKISHYDPIIIDGDIIDVFKTVTSFNKIVACQGTFSFWGSFLSEADIIYWPITTNGPNSGSNSESIVFNTYVNLLVDDEPRYKHIKVQ